MVIWACVHMVARESFGSAVFVGEEGDGGAAYGNNKEEQDDIEEELQVSMLSQEPTSSKVEKKPRSFQCVCIANGAAPVLCDRSHPPRWITARPVAGPSAACRPHTRHRQYDGSSFGTDIC